MAPVHNPAIPEGWPLEWHIWMTVWANVAPEDKWSWEIKRRIPKFKCEDRIWLAEQGYRDHQIVAQGTCGTGDACREIIAEYIRNNDLRYERLMYESLIQTGVSCEARGTYQPGTGYV